MSQNSNPPVADKKQAPKTWSWIIVYPLWVLAIFYGVQVILSGLKIGDAITIPGLLELLVKLGVPFDAINASVLQAILTAVVFTAVVSLVLWLPKFFKKDDVTKEELGLTRPLSWLDLGIGPLAFIPYVMISGLALWAIDQLIPGFDLTEKQDVGFDAVTTQANYLFAFVTLVVVAPLAEELLFRGYLYGKLRQYGVAVAMITTSLTFAFLHGQWNVALDVFVLSLVLCSLREMTGSIWAGVVLHMTKNSVAFFYLFIAPVLIH